LPPRSGYTSMGSKEGFLPNTHWTEILEVRTQDDGRRQRALASLLGRYWKPIYCYLRRKGSDRDRAKDLTQGFILEVVLGRRLVDRAEQAKGRFRTFLLTALDRYVISAHRRETGATRMPKGGVIADLDQINPDNVAEPSPQMSPQEAFVCEEARLLLAGVLGDLKVDCLDRGQAVHWAIFQARVMDPILSGSKASPMSELCATHNVGSPKQAANMIITVKRRFKAMLEQAMREMAGADADVHSEIRDLIGILSSAGAAPAQS
jgi:DNA-directed RNA polymerase specialized sigma24 family protein